MNAFLKFGGLLVYRALERQFMEKEEAKSLFNDLAKSSCNDAPSYNSKRSLEPHKTHTRNQKGDGYVNNLKTYTKCALSSETMCNGGLYQHDFSNDGRWAWTISRIGYIKYFHVLSQWAAFPETVIGNELEALQKITLDNIERRLKRPKTLQNYSGNEGGMGLNNDVENDRGRTDDLERILALKWDKYLATLPKSRQATLPDLEYDPSCDSGRDSLLLKANPTVKPPECDACGGGEMSVKIKSDPPDAKIRIISDFDWQLCRDLKRDPWNPETCWGWSRIVTKKLPLIGIYRYVAEWKDGKTSRDVVKIETLDREENNYITFR